MRAEEAFNSRGRKEIKNLYATVHGSTDNRAEEWIHVCLASSAFGKQLNICMSTDEASELASGLLEMINRIAKAKAAE